jgi:GTP-binding protein EngB required for normal cell division
VPDAVQEAIAELVFADHLVDEHELHTIEAHDWLTAYLQHHQLNMASFSARLMTAHDDPAVDARALQQLLPVDRKALFELLVDLLAIDGHADPREIETLALLTEKLGLPLRPLEQLLQEAAPRIAPIRERLNQPLPTPRKRVRLLRRTDRLLGQRRIDQWAARLGQQPRLRRWRRETFFNHKAYAESLEQMRLLTAELMPTTQEVLQNSTTTLETLREKFQGVTAGLIGGELPKDSQEQLSALLNGVRERLDQLVQQDLGELRNDLLAKQRSLDRFCMAAVGRTKAGKSTLITTLTGRDQGAIGDGRQGFTRYNRAYNFCGIRLIDTPGIGAAGGQGESSEQAEQRDSAVARSIFPETDLVCFVIDSDSTVPCTRDMMQQLHQRGKAFLILLNVKASLQGGRDLLRSRLEAKFAAKGEQAISGNIAAIRRDLAKAIGVQEAEAIPIIPIHAKAAFKAGQVTDPIEAEEWRELSRLDQFLEQLDQLITQQAPELRRRTLRDNPRQELERIVGDLDALAQTLDAQATVFGETEVSATKQVTEIFADLKSSLRHRVEKLFQQLEVEATTFSADHYRKSGKEIERRWRQVLEKFDLNQKLKDELTWLKSELATRLEELQADILERLQFQVGTVNLKHRLDFSFDIGFEENMRRTINLGFKVLSGVLGIAVVALGVVAWPIGLAAALIGMMPAILDWFLPNAEARRQEARNSLKYKLLDTFVEPRVQIATQFEEILGQVHDQVLAALQQSLGSSRLALLAFHEQLLATETELTGQAQQLD